MRYKREKSNCAQCPLRDRKRVWGEGAGGGKIVFLGEAPGVDEDVAGRPFVGNSGSFLSYLLGVNDVRRFQQYLTNVLPCRPPSNDIGSFEAEEALVQCKPGLEEELVFLRSRGYSVIVALGATAMNALGIEGSIMKNRGSVYEAHGFVVVPTLHPAALLRQQSKKKGAKGGYKFIVISDIGKAKALADNGWSPPRELFNISPTVEEVEDFIHGALSTNALVACDIETTGKGANADLVVVGLALDGERALAVPFYSQGGIPVWSNGKKKRIENALRDLFTHGSFVFQYAPFDVPFLVNLGYPKELLRNVKHDTLILHSVVNPELPHRLDFIVSEFGSTPYWKEEFKSRDGSIFNLDDDTLRRYNLRDAVVLHQVLRPMLDELKERGLEEIYYQERMRMLPAIMKMKFNGIGVDRKKVAALKKDLQKEKGKVEEKLRSIADLPPSFNPDSGDDMRYLLFSVKPKKFEKIEELRDFEPRTEVKYECTNEECKKKTYWAAVGGKNTCPKCHKQGTTLDLSRERSRRKVGTQVHKDLLAIKEIAEQTRTLYLPPRFTPRTTESDAISTDQQGLLSLQVSAQNRLKEIEGFKKPREDHKVERKKIEKLLSFLSTLYEYRRLGKLLSTYTSFPTGSDGRVRAEWLIHGTATGRISCSEPNLMNIPKKELRVRKVFTAKEGHCFLSADFSNLEVRVLAYETNDEVLIDILEGGLNLHDHNTETLFHISSNDPKWKLGRRAAKIFMFGGISYGGGDREIYEKVILEAPELGLTFGEYRAAKRRFMDAHPAYAAWAERVKRKAREERIATTFAGGKRFLTASNVHDVEKQGLNSPIQGGAAHVINRAMVAIDEEIEERGLPFDIILQVHDQLVYEVPLETVSDAAELVQRHMEAPTEFYGRSVVFPVDVEIGLDWGSLESYTPEVYEECLKARR